MLLGGALLLVAAASAPAIPEHAVVLLYHHVDAATPAVTSTPPEVFAGHLQLLADEGCTVLPLTAVVEGLRDPGTVLPDRTVALTFDDGYRSVHREAWPLLRARGWPFTVFVSPADIDQGHGPVCSWDELREMAAAGATIASHGLGHEHLQRLRAGEDEDAWRARVRTELLAARQRIEDEIGAAPALLAYPYGEWSPALAALVAELGWTGFGQQSGPLGEGSDFRALPRFPAAGAYAEAGSLIEKLRTLPLPVLAVEPEDPRLPLPPGRERVPRPELRLRLDSAGGPWSQVAAFAGGAPLKVTARDDTVAIAAEGTLAAGRARTNVTAPSLWPGRWYWYSHVWIVGEEHRD